MCSANRFFFPSSRHAFSLVELSIVLVILGLLTGGILAGQSLIRASELRSVSSDMERYQTAIYSFRDKYLSLPGDMPNATSFWDIAAGATGSDNTCYSQVSTSSATCNGNGNGKINLAGLNGAAEINRLWQHLSNAGLIEGNFVGADALQVLGTHLPKSKINNAGFAIAWTDYLGDWGETFSSASNGNQLFFGTLAAGITRGVALKPEEAWNIDVKMDDGKPDAGKLQTETGYSTACFTGAYPNAVYALTFTSVACSFRLQLK